MNPPRPPADVRALAAACHLGVYVALVALLVASLVADVVMATGRYPEHRSEVFMLLLAGGAFGPPLAAIWASRRSPWGGFLFAHGANALVIHLGTLAWVIALVAYAAMGAGDHPIWNAVAFVGSVCVFLHWLGVHALSAHCALCGEVVHYPLQRGGFGAIAGTSGATP